MDQYGHRHQSVISSNQLSIFIYRDTSINVGCLVKILRSYEVNSVTQTLQHFIEIEI